jgi:serine phosphatase RsbU (regulator of sigma subunit)
VFTVEPDRVWIVIGDVAGHGLEAAAAMGRLRSALRAYTLDTDDPAEVLAKLDRHVHQFEPGNLATVLCGVLEPDRRRLRLSSAGHMPPIMARPGAVAELLDIPPDLPLAVELGHPRRVSTLDLAPGSVLVLYTDGLVERRGASIDVGLERLRAAVHAEPAEQVCIKVMGAMVAAAEPTDDIAVLVLAT